jgi:predicted nucleotidyltransferase component of viral defense system
MSGKNVAASVRQRLLNLSRKTGEDFQLLLTRYAVERLLYRLAESEYAASFVLKGAMLFALWTGEMHRPTRDLDLLGFGDGSERELTNVFRSLCSTVVTDDGLTFSADTVNVEPIREDQEYGGQRVHMVVQLGSARVDLQVDVGFRDAITPRPEPVTYPTILGMDPPRLRAYPRETVVAEKLEAMVKLGLTNSRMKDFYDLAIMARTFPFTGPVLRDAIEATFTRRGTAMPTTPPVALTEAFGSDETKQKQWQAFHRRSSVAEKVGDLRRVVAELAAFLGQPLAAAPSGASSHSHGVPGARGSHRTERPQLTYRSSSKSNL